MKAQQKSNIKNTISSITRKTPSKRSNPEGKKRPYNQISNSKKDKLIHQVNWLVPLYLFSIFQQINH